MSRLSSMSQLERFGRVFANISKRVGIQINPWRWVGGILVFHHRILQDQHGRSVLFVRDMHELVTNGTVPSNVNKYGLVAEQIHTHIGSGSDPAVGQTVAKKSLSFCATWVTVHTLNLGGGYKVGHNPGEKTTDPGEIGSPVADALRDFTTEHGRELRLEIEPGMYLVGNAGALCHHPGQDSNEPGIGPHPSQACSRLRRWCR